MILTSTSVTFTREEDDFVQAEIGRLRERLKDGRGVPIGVNDRNGKPIHIGDTLRFEEQEWGETMEFVIELRDGQIQHPGATGDLSSWCEVVKPWGGESAAGAKRGVGTP